MIIVHHLENSRSQRVLWMLEELGLPYEIQRYERDRKTMLAPPELKRVHPLGKSPVIVDTRDDHRVIAETGAIVEYLVDKADGRLGAPATRGGALDYRFWLHYAEGSLMPPLLVKLVLTRVPLFGKVAKRLPHRVAVNAMSLRQRDRSRQSLPGLVFAGCDRGCEFVGDTPPGGRATIGRQKTFTQNV